MQNPEERPYVVSTMRSPSRFRTKQSPRCPSASVQSRGHTSHRMRSFSTCQKFFLRDRSRVTFRDRVATKRDVARPKCRCEMRFAFELVQKFFGHWELGPHLRKERRASFADQEHDAVARMNRSGARLLRFRRMRSARAARARKPRRANRRDRTTRAARRARSTNAAAARSSRRRPEASGAARASRCILEGALLPLNRDERRTQVVADCI